MTKIIGIDIGGTKTTIGIVDIKSGKILQKISIPSKKNANDKKNGLNNDAILLFLSGLKYAYIE